MINGQNAIVFNNLKDYFLNNKYSNVKPVLTLFYCVYIIDLVTQSQEQD